MYNVTGKHHRAYDLSHGYKCLCCLQLQLQLTPLQTGELHITGLAYNLGSSSQNASQPAMNPATGKPSFVSTICVRGKVPLEVQGPRLNTTKQEKAGKAYGPDRRLDLVVVPSMPRLQVSGCCMPQLQVMVCCMPQ